MKKPEEMTYDFLGAKRKDAAKNEYGIIKILALKGEQTVEHITREKKRAANLWIVAKTRMDSLERRGFVHVYRTEPKKRGKGNKTFYVLTFRGLVGYFESLYWEALFDYQSEPLDFQKYEKHISRIIEKYGQIFDYPIFKDWNFFVSRWKNCPYSWLLLGSLASRATEPVWNKRGRPLEPEEIEDYCKQTLLYEFFSLMYADSRITVKPTTFNSAVVNLMARILARKEKELNDEIEKLEMLKRLIKAE